MTKEIFGEMILENKEVLYRVAKSILKNDDDCADAISEGITVGFAKLSTLKNDRYAKTWLIRIVINECYKVYRKAWWKMDSLDAEPVEVVPEKEDYSDLYDAIGHLTERQRLMIVLYYLEGYSTKEVAQILKTTVASVKMNLTRARKKLKTYLEESL